MPGRWGRKPRICLRINLEPLLTARDVKTLLKCSLPLVYKMADRGQLPCVRWKCPGEGKKQAKTIVRFKKTDVIKFIEKNYK